LLVFTHLQFHKKNVSASLCGSGTPHTKVFILQKFYWIGTTAQIHGYSLNSALNFVAMADGKNQKKNCEE
jgi:hypothetical protein